MKLGMSPNYSLTWHEYYLFYTKLYLELYLLKDWLKYTALKHSERVLNIMPGNFSVSHCSPESPAVHSLLFSGALIYIRKRWHTSSATWKCHKWGSHLTSEEIDFEEKSQKIANKGETNQGRKSTSTSCNWLPSMMWILPLIWAAA